MRLYRKIHRSNFCITRMCQRRGGSRATYCGCCCWCTDVTELLWLLWFAIATTRLSSLSRVRARRVGKCIRSIEETAPRLPKLGLTGVLHLELLCTPHRCIKVWCNSTQSSTLRELPRSPPELASGKTMLHTLTCSR